MLAHAAYPIYATSKMQAMKSIGSRAAFCGTLVVVTLMAHVNFSGATDHRRKKQNFSSNNGSSHEGKSGLKKTIWNPAYQPDSHAKHNQYVANVIGKKSEGSAVKIAFFVRKRTENEPNFQTLQVATSLLSNRTFHDIMKHLPMFIRDENNGIGILVSNDAEHAKFAATTEQVKKTLGELNEVYEALGKFGLPELTQQVDTHTFTKGYEDVLAFLDKK